MTLSHSQVEQFQKVIPSGLEENKTAKKSWVHEWQVALKRDKYLYLLAAPGLLFFLIFKYVPLWGLLLAFQNYSPYLGFWDSEWVGLKYFHEFFTNPDFMMLFRNTMAISLLNIVFFFPIPIVVSLLLNEVKSLPFKKIVQTVIYLPHFLSWVIIVGICFLILGQSSGVINQLIVEFGGHKIEFLTEPNYFWALLTAQSIWKEAGWGTIIFLAALAGINSELYEAAQIDGATRWQQMRNVTIPGIKSTIIVLLILRLGQVMDVGFEQIFLMASGPVSQVADVFDTYAYRVGIQQGRFSYATVAGLFKSVVGLILVVTANRVAKKFGEEGLY
ncbi:polysaccharide ABC transporter ATP-binding protein [Paenibacillus sp. Soil766]|uniref:ABC transporter permease n=1 Tax=Paenibacillus sp. Soil766 TaxID=1736404 RepID=UPI00070AAD16|nr:sugar ABC transporter permease [Paenibacillus sp. Soil766]KRF07235.1 polysaccharide ABC transporter ATP-binding protein [Paenibacillus sp. Soil766]